MTVKKIEKRTGIRKIMPWLCAVVLSAGIFVTTGANAGFFELMGQSARAVGMGEVFMASSMDASGYWYNPAGLTMIGAPQAAFSYGGLQTDYNMSNYQLNYTTLLGDRSGIGVGLYASTVDAANQLVLSGAYGLSLTERISLGANVKLMRWAIEGQDDPYNPGLSDDDLSNVSFGLDASVMYGIGEVLGIEDITIGGYIVNANNPNISESGANTGELSREIGIGLMGRLAGVLGEVNVGRIGEANIIRGGAETELTGLMVRGGAIYETSPLDSDENRTSLGLGLGYTFGSVVFNYAFNYLLNLEEGRHFVTLGIAF